MKRPPEPEEGASVRATDIITLDLDGRRFADRVTGCWLGKNAGGTLGAPLERAWGQPEPFDVWWYPELREGGIPNDDLEMQLVWLKALEEVGPSLRARDLARYWIDHIGYNFDEYGLSKTNLRLGLEPPVSGAYNNWFKDCMGCPIRSEIWACVAPGMPRVAARYAYEDAICDHAGGESVYGELFNVAVESAAFVIPDRDQLIEIGLSYVPPGSATSRAVLTALEAHAAGQDWKAARSAVLRSVPHPVAQYSPINIGFQAVGWLYGEDFGDALCKAVNCGYDTDCTGATLGSILGIISGASGLPERWIAPLGQEIATNESWGGVRHMSGGPGPVPATVPDLTDRTCRMARRVLDAHGLLRSGGVIEIDPEQLRADESVRRLWNRSPMRVDYDLGELRVGIDYGDSPAVVPGVTKRLVLHVANPHPDPIKTTCRVLVPETWDAPRPVGLEVAAGAEASAEVTVRVPPSWGLDTSNRLHLAAEVGGHPHGPAVPVVLIGASAYRVTGPYDLVGMDVPAALDHPFPPEELTGDPTSAESRGGQWLHMYALDNGLPLSDIFSDSGVVYVQGFVWAPAARDVWLGIDASVPRKVWSNGQPVMRLAEGGHIRPNYSGNREGYRTISLREGWNELLIKLVHPAGGVPPQCHVLLSSDDRFHDGLFDVLRTRFPWDAPRSG